LIMQEKIQVDKKQFSSRTVKNILVPIIEFFTFEMWAEATSTNSNYSSERIDRLKNCILEAVRVYGLVVGMLTFP
jgi:hypothetical protein